MSGAVDSTLIVCVMVPYRLLLLSRTGAVLETRSVECADDAAARVAAFKALEGCSFVEIWSAGRRLELLSRPDQKS